MFASQCPGSGALAHRVTYCHSYQHLPKTHLAQDEAQLVSKNLSPPRISLPRMDLSQTSVWKEFESIGQSHGDCQDPISSARQTAMMKYLSSPAGDTVSFPHRHSNVSIIASKSQQRPSSSWRLQESMSGGQVDLTVDEQRCYCPAIGLVLGDDRSRNAVASCSGADGKSVNGYCKSFEPGRVDMEIRRVVVAMVAQWSSLCGHICYHLISDYTCARASA